MAKDYNNKENSERKEKSSAGKNFWLLILSAIMAVFTVVLINL